MFEDVLNIYVVGGAVRDVLLGRMPKDIDYVVVGATPQQMLDLGFQQVGADFPVFLDSDGNEFALARTERKTGVGYNGFETDHSPNVTLNDDLLRRDLTINAMAVELENWDDFIATRERSHVIDPCSGQKDLELCVLRHVSDAFAEDPVRILRVARFAARYDFDVHPNTLDLMSDLVKQGEANHLVPERIWSEMERALQEPQPTLFFRVLDACGALDIISPEMQDLYDLVGTQLTFASNNNFSVAEIVATLCVHIFPDEVKAMSQRLKMPNDVSKLASMTSEAWPLLNCWNRNSRDENTAEDAMKILETVGGFATNSNLDSLVKITRLFNEDLNYNVLTLQSLAEKAGKLSFNQLSTEQQETLKGKEISAAIRQMRVEKMKACLDIFKI